MSFAARPFAPKNDGDKLMLILRFQKHITVDGNCWRFNGRKNPRGYGAFSVRAKDYQAHRIAWVLWCGPLASDVSIDHLCLHPWCVNPGHMEPVPLSVNTKRQHARLGVTLCKKGHEIHPNGGKHRQCKVCRAENDARYYQEVTKPKWRERTGYPRRPERLKP